VPILALNEPPPGTDVPANIFTVSLSLEQEARQAALLAVAEGRHTAVVIHSPCRFDVVTLDGDSPRWIRAAFDVDG
jgi:outer membrane PBP1 activator LpoA protein